MVTNGSATLYHKTENGYTRTFIPAVCWQGAVIFAAVVLLRWKLPKLNPLWSLALSALLGYVLFL